MSTIPSQNWPKSYLLQLHSEAIKHGAIWVQPITKANALSLKQRLYRVRRRSDTATASFIPPEYHLVNVGEWQPGPDGLGRLPLIYSQLPDNQPLPGIVPMEPGARQLPDPLRHEPLAIPPITEADLTLDPASISDYVAGMIKKARGE